MELIPFAGFERCAQIRQGNLAVVVTLEVGPRILFFGPIDENGNRGQNMLAVYARDYGIKDDGKYHSYGGHRLWVAPEERPKTYFADSSEVEFTQTQDQFIFTSKTDEYHIQKEIRVKIVGTDAHPAFQLEHRVYNHGAYPAELAPWAITVMEPGGECIFPQADFEPHTSRLLPKRSIVLWAYTRMEDPRWTWGNRMIRLKQTPAETPQKAGMRITQGIAAYNNFGMTFIKRFTEDPTATYPDMDCNFEVFTRNDMLEVESLGPLAKVMPGASVSHTETWYLLQDSQLPVEDGAVANWLHDVAAICPQIAN